MSVKICHHIMPRQMRPAYRLLYARHFRTSISSRCVIQALRFFRRKIGTPLLVVWDRLNAHRSRVTTDFIASHAQDYAVAYLPAYAPELNPEEQCNALVKRAMANALLGSVDDLHRLARREFGRLKRHPEMIVRFFRHAGLSVTGHSWGSIRASKSRQVAPSRVSAPIRLTLCSRIKRNPFVPAAHVAINSEKSSAEANKGPGNNEGKSSTLNPRPSIYSFMSGQ
jgi:transposase